ncbi:methionine adenosyltransferase [Methylocystis heyeri]|uniref:Methionine adenosyltransferase n=1 Tax=Methylocystis heyeri TaxID=391905 RepID=A0A6B8KCS1_9HYPH|nr:methionine adenosyltransferase [Methylocystis heyeri]QGM44318.1 methionine adenosyltransferase [Methylocystis heyeri]
MTADMIFTSESVTAGHPDKLCDQISDAAIDAFLREDSGAYAIVECAVAAGVIFLAARYAAEADLDLPSVARQVIADTGYSDGRFDARRCSILTSFMELPLTMRQPPMAAGDEEWAQRCAARDQANVFGYACRDTPELMPLPISLAHRLARELDNARQSGLSGLSPDAKTQVSVEYRGGRPVRIHGVAITAAVSPDERTREFEDRLQSLALDTLAEGEIRPDAKTEFYISVNAGAPYVIDGPARHAGLTGRKNGIDTYGEIARHSGAALSGKDPSRIDRIGAYAARHAAKNLVAAGLAEKCEVHLGYAIGQSAPLSVSVETFGTGRLPDAELSARLQRHYDFRPAAIERRFKLRTHPALANAGLFRPLAVYGHFGRPELGLPWEDASASLALRE